MANELIYSHAQRAGASTGSVPHTYAVGQLNPTESAAARIRTILQTTARSYGFEFPVAAAAPHCGRSAE